MPTPAPSPLTPMQTSWLAEVLDRPIPGEARATCDDCAMCSHVAPGAASFNRDTKCCTFVPTLPNYLVGRILADDDPAMAAGRESVGARIAAGVAVTPLGLERPAVDGLLYRFGAERGFGQSRALRCPHYVEDGGRCGIWRHRNSVCATWFCKHDRGALGSSFWGRVKELLSAIEEGLARSCVLDLGLGDVALAALFPLARGADDRLSLVDLEGRSDPVARRALWGAWAGREGELFRACAAIVDRVDFAEVVRRCGDGVRLRAELVRVAWQKLAAPEPPARLRLGRLDVVRLDAASCRVATYSGLDPIEMPRELFDVLHHFDGRPNADARAAISSAGGPQLTDGLVRKMADFAILVPADDDATD
jgi:hypothetical protein